jgi:putative sterol carrier protein
MIDSSTGNNATISTTNSHTMAHSLSPHYDYDLDEMLTFFQFSRYPASSFEGTFLFDLKYDENTNAHCYVHVKPNRETICEKIVITDSDLKKESSSSYNCRLSMDRQTFFDVYFGRLHPHSAIMAGQIHLEGGLWKMKHVAAFARSFDMSKEKWVDFYEEDEVQQKLTEIRQRIDSAKSATSSRSQSLPASSSSSLPLSNESSTSSTPFPMKPLPSSVSPLSYLPQFSFPPALASFFEDLSTARCAANESSSSTNSDTSSSPEPTSSSPFFHPVFSNSSLRNDFRLIPTLKRFLRKFESRELGAENISFHLSFMPY